MRVSSSCEERAYRGRDLVKVRLKCKMTRRQQLDDRARYVSLECTRSRWQEIRVKLSPHGQERRLRGSEVVLELGVELYVVGVVEEEVELDLHVPGSSQESGIEVCILPV